MKQNNNINNINNININNINFQTSKKFQKFIPFKRNYNSLINNNNQLISQNNNISNTINTTTNTNTHINTHTNTHTHIPANTHTYPDPHINNIILNQQQQEKEKERLIERKKTELKTVDKVAQELLESKNENELKEYLFIQLRLLDQKKRIEFKNEQIKNRISDAVNQLNNDKIELRKCNTAVTRVLNKKTVELYNLENKKNKLEKEINNVKESLNYHVCMGDLYNEKLKELKGNYYEEY